MKNIGLIGLMGLMILGTCLALTPKERELVQGLNGINAELRASATAQAAQIEKLSADAVFAQQKIDSLTANLTTAKQAEEAQLQDLLLQAGKIAALAADRDKQLARADAAEKTAAKKTAEAHRNAVERDVCLWSLALAVTVLVLTCAGQIIGWIVRFLPAAAPYGALIEIGLALGTFFGTYGAARGVLAMIKL